MLTIRSLVLIGSTKILHLRQNLVWAFLVRIHLLLKPVLVVGWTQFGQTLVTRLPFEIWLQSSCCEEEVVIKWTRTLQSRGVPLKTTLFVIVWLFSASRLLRFRGSQLMSAIYAFLLHHGRLASISKCVVHIVVAVDSHCIRGLQLINHKLWLTVARHFSSYTHVWLFARNRGADCRQYVPIF